MTLDLVTNAVFHVTYFPASDESWTTFTNESKVIATDTITGVVYTGHSTFWGNENVNRQYFNFTYTATISVRGDDGSRISFHEVAHATMLPDGNIAVSFDKASVTCT